MSEHWEIAGAEDIPDTRTPNSTKLSFFAIVIVVVAVVALGFIL